MKGRRLGAWLVAAVVLAVAAALSLALIRGEHHKSPAQSPSVAHPATRRQAPAGRVLWRADGSQPLQNEWASYATQDRCWDRDSAITAAGRSSSRAFQTSAVAPTNEKVSYAFHLLDGDACSGERAELGQGNPIKTGLKDRLFHRGDDVWIAYQFLIPSGDPPPSGRWECLGQLKGLGDGGPVVCADFVDDRLALLHADSVFQSSTDTDRLWTAPGPVVRGRWIRYLLHVRFDPDPAIGFLEFSADLADGQGMQPRIAHQDLATMKLQRGTANPIPVNARIGIYRDRAAVGPARVYFAGYTVGTTRGVVEANAFGQTP